LCRRAATPFVLERAIRAAQDRLPRWGGSSDGAGVEVAAVVAALEEVIFDPAVDIDNRALAVIALFEVPGPQVGAVFLRAARCDVLPLQVEGALGLTHDDHLDRHRDLIRDLAESWPTGTEEPDRAWLVRHALRT
jgi:hypothetical protein